MNQIISITCPRCNTMSDSKALFCYNCGQNLTINIFNANIFNANILTAKKKDKLVYIILLIPLFAVAFYISNQLVGDKPTKTYEQVVAGHNKDAVSQNEGSIPLDSPRNGTNNATNQTNAENPHDTNDSKLLLLRKQVNDDPKDLLKLKEYADYLLTKIKDGSVGTSIGLTNKGLILEAVDALSGVIQTEPQNADALGALADLSFDQKVFAKAVDYYKKYLELRPEDLAVKSRLASSLVFLKRTDEALAMLNDVLKKEPNNFHALAYSSIALSEKNDIEGAKNFALKAIENAPSEDAKNRIQMFIDNIIKKTSTSSNNINTENKAPDNTNNSKEVAVMSQNFPAIEQYFKSNEITKDKFIKVEQQAEILKLYFKDFPMQAMPPFAKEKFFSKIKEGLNGNNTVKKLQFYDAISLEIIEEHVL